MKLPGLYWSGYLWHRRLDSFWHQRKTFSLSVSQKCNGELEWQWKRRPETSLKVFFTNFKFPLAMYNSRVQTRKQKFHGWLLFEFWYILLDAYLITQVKNNFCGNQNTKKKLVRIKEIIFVTLWHSSSDPANAVMMKSSVPTIWKILTNKFISF